MTVLASSHTTIRATKVEQCRVIGVRGGSHAHDGSVGISVVPPPPRGGRTTMPSSGAGGGHAAAGGRDAGRWHNDRHRINEDDCRCCHSGGENARHGDCDADNRCA